MTRRFWRVPQYNIIPAFPSGAYLVWGPDSDVASIPYAQGGQIVLDWASVETARGTFDWSQLNQELAYYASIGKPCTVQVNSSQKPAWIYSISGINKVGTFAGGSATWDIPRYWGNSYLTVMQEMLVALAAQLRTSPYKNTVLAVRCSPNLIGTEQYDLSDPRATITDSTAMNTWTMQIAYDCYEQVMRNCSAAFLPDIRHILRATLFVSMNTDPTLRTDLLGVNKGWVFGTNGNPDNDLPNIDNFFYDWAVSGLTKGYYESSLYGDQYSHGVSWVYWRQLLELSRGVSYIATYSQDLEHTIAGSANTSEYQAAFSFSNTYAGWQSKPASSPGAFTAFRGGQKSTDINYDFLLQLYNADGSPGGDNSTVALDSNAGASPIGPIAQRYGRFARRTDVASGKSTFYLRLDSTFKASLASTVTVKVTYLDSGISNWILKWGTAANQQQSFTKTNTGNWLTVSRSVPVSEMTGTLSVSSDLQLIASGADTTFHMVEVQRV